MDDEYMCICGFYGNGYDIVDHIIEKHPVMHKQIMEEIQGEEEIKEWMLSQLLL